MNNHTNKGPQEKREHSRQMGMEEAEAASQSIAEETAEAGEINDMVPEDLQPDRGVFRDERRERDAVRSPDDDRSPNLPDHANEDIDDYETPAPARDEGRPEADRELLENAYSQNDPGVETKE